MTQFRHKTVLITGGARGLGRLIAERSLAEGAGRIVLWDIDESLLGETARELAGRGARVDTATVDVADEARIAAAAAAFQVDGASVDILFNNAGIVVGKPFADHSVAEIERSIRVNVLGVMHTTRAFLPRMIERERGHIVNIASAAGLVPTPGMAVYAASKWAVLGWSESLRLELEARGRRPRVTTICPSFVATGMFAGARPPRLTPMLAPETVVDRIVRAVKANRILLRTPPIVSALPLLRGVLPTRWFDVLVGRGFRIYDSMSGFVGRSAER